MKKIICIFLCILMAFSSLSVFSYALKAEMPIEWVYVDALEFPDDEIVIPERTNQAIKFYSNPGMNFSFYNALSADAKKIYDAIVAQKAGLYTEGIVDGMNITGMSNYTLALQAALTAVIDDYPEYFWIGGYGAGGSYTNFKVTLALNTSSYADWDTVKDCYNQMMAKVNSMVITGNNRYEKLKSIHDQICNMTTYNGGAMAHEPTGVFLNGVSVCEGYAEATKLLCDRENIPCICVVGTGNGGAHKWNYIQMEDGKWYGLDATWDDQGTIYYDYFLVGSETINAVFGKRKFGDGTNNESTGGDHVNVGTHFQNAQYALTYPSISTQSYMGVIPMWDSNASFDSTKNFMYISKDDVAEEQILCTFWAWSGNAPSTNVATVTGVTTGGTVKITSPITKTYTIVRYGDVNKDNAVNITDYNNVKDIVTCDAKAYSDKAQFAAADMNGDGVIDAFDAIAIDVEIHK